MHGTVIAQVQNGAADNWRDSRHQSRAMEERKQLPAQLLGSEIGQHTNQAVPQVGLTPAYLMLRAFLAKDDATVIVKARDVKRALTDDQGGDIGLGGFT